MRRRIARVVFNLGVDKEFDYYISRGNVDVGFRVWVEFNHKRRVGLVTKVTSTSSVRNLKPILEAIDNFPTISKEHLKFAKLLKKNYPYSLGELLFMMIPPPLRRKKRIPSTDSLNSAFPHRGRKGKNICFIRGKNFLERVKLYRKKIEEKLKEGSVILCLPTFEYVEKVKELLSNFFPKELIILHSYQRSKEFLSSWVKLKRGNKLILGMRATLFYYPLNLSCIILEEEASPYYFHPEKPYYHLFDIAYLLSKFKNIDFILGGDYPTLNTFKMIKEGKISLKGRERKLKHVEVVRAKTFNYYKHKTIVNPLLKELLRKHLEEKKRILILYSRKGFASFIKCLKCGYVYMCPKCFTPLRYSLREKRGECLWCSYKENLGSLCKICNSGYITTSGVGIERLAYYLRQSFPEVEFSYSEEINHPVNLATYSILDSSSLIGKDIDVAFLLGSDYFLSRIDFETSLRLYIYLKRLAGLVKEKVYVLSENLEHYLWELVNKPLEAFYTKEVHLRKEARLPPYQHLAKITVRGKNRNRLLEKANQLYNLLKNSSLEVFGPVQEFPLRLRGKFYYSIIAKSKSKLTLGKKVKEVVEVFPKGSYKIAVVLR
ncbi:MAG: hypothetical protein J7K17_05130 [Candidatus Omnitrophica bacterium]|nr:hypothetical protein [Candidatus Omnitrophota bacterium]